MAISENEKQNIIEEEGLRFEARRKLMSAQGQCCHSQGHGHCCRSLWGWIVAAALAVALVLSYCHHHFYYGPMGQGFGPRCLLSQVGPDGGSVPPQAPPQAKK
jgi:hypothetical protein